jgi:hypothetical protein
MENGFSSKICFNAAAENGFAPMQNQPTHTPSDLKNAVYDVVQTFRARSKNNGRESIHSSFGSNFAIAAMISSATCW